MSPGARALRELLARVMHEPDDEPVTWGELKRHLDDAAWAAGLED